jgi:hypothetical protein
MRSDSILKVEAHILSKDDSCDKPKERRQLMKASEIIKELEKAIEEHGDLEVYTGGTDFEDEMTGVFMYIKNRNSHYEKKAFFTSQRTW